jgi:hypothetical protein
MKIYMVLQEGGASNEWYASFHDTVEEAEATIASHAEATYSAVGPYELTVPDDLDKRDDFWGVLHEVANRAAVAATSHQMGV